MLKIKHISLAEANAFVTEHHRHHPKAQGHKYSLACYDNDRLCGVAIVGHPQGIKTNDGETLEVLRLCTDGTKNACSMLYGRCARVGHELGYEKIQTYILVSETGTSLKASGWICEDACCGGNGKWTGNRQKQRDMYQQMSLFPMQKEVPQEYKQKWVKSLVY